MKYPRPEKGTRVRIFGPEPNKHGMNVYKVFDVLTGRQIGPDCLSSLQAKKRAEDFLSGKKFFWFGNIPFERKKLG